VQLNTQEMDQDTDKVEGTEAAHAMITRRAKKASEISKKGNKLKRKIEVKKIEFFQEFFEFIVNIFHDFRSLRKPISANHNLMMGTGCVKVSSQRSMVVFLIWTWIWSML
jgi:hypothetical protein